MDTRKIVTLNRMLFEYYEAHGRHDMPWRQPEADGEFDPYKILVSELMLQQTQVARVIPKFHQFIEQFPNTYALAHAPFAEVLSVWSGLGYNRRAKFLWQAAQKIEQEFDGTFPTSKDGLVALPGVGPNTAGAIMAYAYNEPVAFVETNIRSVFIHHLFRDETGVTDRAILEAVALAMSKDNARVWYWALMDYGTYLKQTVGNSSRASKTYKKQSKFHGSRRQIRGEIIRLLLEKSYTIAELSERLSDERLESILTELVEEGMLKNVRNTYTIFDA